jgi:hypothetical protein
LGFLAASLTGAGIAGLATGATGVTVPCGHRSLNSNERGGAAIVGRLLSMMTRSGNFSAEAILIADRVVTLSGVSIAGGGKHQPMPINTSNRALPTKPKYPINGMGIASHSRRP